MTVFTIHVCVDIWGSYIRALQADEDHRWAQHEVDEDREHEHELRAEFFEALEEDGEAVWPEYADPPFEVERPQMFNYIPNGFLLDDAQESA